MPKRQLPLQADLVINHLRWEAMIDRQCDTFDIDYADEVYFCLIGP